MGMAHPAFGGIEDTFVQLEKWGSGTDLSLTKILDPAPDDEDLPVYLLGITKIGGDYVFACWNEVPSAEGAVTSISKNSKVGAPAVHKNPFDPNTIPGYPTYFWVLPDLKVIASVKSVGGASGMEAMQDYVKKFLLLKSQYVIDGLNEEGQYTVIGHTDRGDNIPQKVNPRFHAATFKKKGRHAFLLENHARITKVVRVGRVAVDKALDQTMLQSFIQFLGGDSNKTKHITGTRKVRLELQYTPSEAELKSMIEADSADDESGRWEDLGFEIPGEGAPVWLGRSRASDTFNVNLSDDGSGVFSVKELAEALAKQRAEMLKLMEDA